MPSVPTYESRLVRDRPILQQDFAVRASPDDFGAAAARGLGAVAQGLGQAADAANTLRDLEAVAEGQGGLDQLSSGIRDASYGEGGFFTLQGKAAVDGLKSYEQRLEEERRRVSSGLSPQARQKFDRVSKAEIDRLLDQAVVHTAGERKRWITDASTARAATFADEALSGYQNPANVQRGIDGGLGELRRQAALQGWDEATLTGKEKQYISTVLKSVALRMAQSDPLAAQRYIDEHKADLTGEHLTDLEAVFAPLVVEERAKQNAERWFSSGGTISGRTLGEAGPSPVRNFLAARTPDKGPEAVDNLDEAFAGNLAAMIQAAPPEIRGGLEVMSGFRSRERQQELWDASDKTGHRVARPGHSKHEFGQAVDLTWKGQRLDKAPAVVRQWVAQAAGQFGMYLPMDYEPWHLEPVGSRGGRRDGSSGASIAAGGRVAPNEFAADDLPPVAYGLLGAIRGGESAHRYDVRFDGGAGSPIGSYADHPRQSARNPRDGSRSSASGAYQFIAGTWDRVAGALGLPDFAPASQDRGAWWLAQADYKQRTGRDLEADLQAGRYGEVRRGLGDTWAALKGMTDAQFAVAAQASGRGVAFNDGGGSLSDPTAYLDSLPATERTATAQRIQLITTMREKQRAAEREAWEQQAFAVVDGGGSPDDIPAEVRAALGREETTGLWSYYENRTKRGQPETDERALYDLQTLYANDPASFGQLDLWRYRGQLDDAAWKEVNGWRQTALTDVRKAKEDGTVITSAFSQAQTQLEAVGITTTGKEGAAREEAARREAQFQNALAAEIAKAKAEKDRNPDQVEIQQMISRLLLPVVVSEPGMMWGTNETEVPLFEAGPLGDRGEGKTARVFQDYQKIPPSDRVEIELLLADVLGRKPSEEEVEAKYAEYLASAYGLGG